MNREFERRLGRLEQQTTPPAQGLKIERAILPGVVIVDAPALPPPLQPRRFGLSHEDWLDLLEQG